MKKTIIKNFNEMYEDIEKVGWVDWDYPIIKFEKWKENRNKLRIYKVKPIRKKFGFINQKVLVFLGKNEYGGNDYLWVVLKGFLIWKFLVGRLISL